MIIWLICGTKYYSLASISIKFIQFFLDNNSKNGIIQMRKIIMIVFVVAGSFLMGACSTVINTTTQNVDIVSDPPNAKITIDGKKFGITPQTVNLERSSNHVVRLELDGYETYETQLTRKISTWFWFNILNGIIPGVVTDMFTGSMYNLLPEVFTAELQPAKVEPVKKGRR